MLRAPEFGSRQSTAGRYLRGEWDAPRAGIWIKAKHTAEGFTMRARCSARRNLDQGKAWDQCRMHLTWMLRAPEFGSRQSQFELTLTLTPMLRAPEFGSRQSREGKPIAVYRDAPRAGIWIKAKR